MAMIQPPLLQSTLIHSTDTTRALPAASGKAVAPKLSFGATVVTGTSKAGAPPLAFGLRLTPATGTSPPPPGATAPQPRSPGPAVTEATATDFATSKTAAGSTQSAPDITEVPAPVAATQPEPSAPETEDGNPQQPAPAVSGIDAKSRQDSQMHEEAVPVVAAVTASAAGNGGPSDFARQMPAAMADAAPDPAVGKTQGAPVTPATPQVSEALRASEPSAPAAPALSSAPINEIAVRISTPQSPPVDVHLMERGGQLHVSVRTADGGLQTSLRQDIGTLVNSLERSGYRAEAFMPREGSPAAALSAQTNSQNGRQEPESGSGGRNGSSGDSSQNSSGGQQQRQEQQRRDPRQPKWIEELENQQ